MGFVQYWCFVTCKDYAITHADCMALLPGGRVIAFQKIDFICGNMPITLWLYAHVATK